MPSFDVVSKVTMNEVDNALNQANKELGQRFDFRAQRLFPGEILRPDLLPLGEIRVPPREEPIARQAEALPDPVFFRP